jgi:hypothetical protein
LLQPFSLVECVLIAGSCLITDDPSRLPKLAGHDGLLCGATNRRSLTNSRAGAIPAYTVLIFKPLERVGVCEIVPPLPFGSLII